MVKRLLTVAFVVVIGGIAALWIGLRDLCANSIVVEAVSPSGEKKAVLFERSCGATTGFSSQLSVISANADLSNEGGNAYVAGGYPEGYELRWLDNSTLQVSGVKGDVRKRDSRVSGVDIHYQR